MQKLIHVEINPPNINPLEIRKKLVVNQEGDRSILTVVAV